MSSAALLWLEPMWISILPGSNVPPLKLNIFSPVVIIILPPKWSFNLLGDAVRLVQQLFGRGSSVGLPSDPVKKRAAKTAQTAFISSVAGSIPAKALAL